MTCEACKKDGFSRLRSIGGGLFVCYDCIPQTAQNDNPDFNFLTVSTVKLPNYYKHRGNVSVNRINMIKSRCLAPEGRGEVVMKNRFGKITDRQAVNY